MARGIAIVIGVRASPLFGTYGLGILEHAEADACKMAEIARGLGYEVSCFLGPDATCAAVENAVDTAAAALTDTDDALLLSFSGHGVPLPGVLCETDGSDEHWCLYDGLVVDDRIRLFWQKMGSQARVYTVADCCHSGDISERIQKAALLHRRLWENAWFSAVARLFVPAAILRLYTDIDRERLKVRNDNPGLNCDPPVARVLLLSSVKAGIARDGAFMRGLRAAWVQPEARKSFRKFRDYIEIEVRKEVRQPPGLTTNNSLLADKPPFKLN